VYSFSFQLSSKYYLADRSKCCDVGYFNVCFYDKLRIDCRSIFRIYEISYIIVLAALRHKMTLCVGTWAACHTFKIIQNTAQILGHKRVKRRVFAQEHAHLSDTSATVRKRLNLFLPDTIKGVHGRSTLLLIMPCSTKQFLLCVMERDPYPCD
jgi:hypothetical protein